MQDGGGCRRCAYARRLLDDQERATGYRRCPACDRLQYVPGENVRDAPDAVAPVEPEPADEAGIEDIAAKLAAMTELQAPAVEEPPRSRKPAPTAPTVPRHSTA